MKIIVSHPTGNRNVRAILNAFEKEGALAEFVTTIAVRPKRSWFAFLPHSLQKELQRREYNLPAHLINTYPLREIIRILLPKLGYRRLNKHETGWTSIDQIYRQLDQDVANTLLQQKKNGVSAVYAYEDGALATFAKAKQIGLSCIYDLPIAYWQTVRQLLTEEAERLPYWSRTLTGMKDSQEKLDRKTEELRLADVIVSPSDFVNNSIPDRMGLKRRIISHFGSPEGTAFVESDLANDKMKTARPLRVLFAGSMTQRKGLGDLFDAMKLIKSRHVELIVMGSPVASMDFYKQNFFHFTYEHGRPHQEVLRLMRSCDVFCLPSIAEGRALVMQEAMSQGLPLIVTPNTGGSDLVIEGSTGYLIPIRSPEAIAEKIDWFAANRSKTEEMGKAAREHAGHYTWQQYGKTITEELNKALT